MKIELQEPFKSVWRNGYLVVNSENRRHICLVNNDTDRTTISYARYLMSVKLGHLVPDDIEVDHIDNDKTNDVIDNLQLLTKADNHLKQKQLYLDTVQNTYLVHCVNCTGAFTITERQLKMKIAQNVTNMYCSHRCSGEYNAYLRAPRF